MVNHYSSTGVGRRINNIYFFDDEIGYAPGWTCIWHTTNGGQVTTSFRSGEAADGARLYPNPAAKVATLEMLQAAMGSFTVVDLQGRPVRHGQAFAGRPSIIPLEGLAPGLYPVLVNGMGGRYVLPLVVE